MKRNGHRVILAALESETDDERDTTMADDSMALLDSVRKAIEEGDGDFLRETVHLLAQGLMEAEVTEITGVPKGERAPDRRLTSRNGYRDRRWDTRVGTIDLAIPRVRDGSYFPSLLEPRRRAERALLAVVQEAYVLGVSTRRVDDLVQSLGITGISKSEVSRICAALDAEVAVFRSRSLAGEAYPYLWLDATVRHEAPYDRVGWKSPPPGCRSSPVKLRAARPWKRRVGWEQP